MPWTVWLTAIAAALGVAVAALLWAWALRRRLTRATRECERERTLRHQIEQKIQTIRDELETRVFERTRALAARNAELSQLRLALEAANQRLRRLVSVDGLTGIANRRHFDRVLEREWRRARREQLPLSLIFLDLDEFKRYNDTYGHARGDEVLRVVALTLDETFRRGGDLVARYGGEEFAVVLPGVDGRRAALYAERLRRRIWCLSLPYEASPVAPRVTISGGVATTAPGDEVSAHDLLQAADAALYRAKCLGRNRIVSGDPTAAAQRLAIG
jgi:diguanylate cyclase (GGDEF)-like protein